jgi:hypothetical protein
MEEGPDRSRATLAFGEHPRFGQPALRPAAPPSRYSGVLGLGIELGRWPSVTVTFFFV